MRKFFFGTIMLYFMLMKDPVLVWEWYQDSRSIL